MVESLISVVDDDESIRRTTALLIESLGFRAEVFESAERFLNSGRLHDTSCLIVDVRMPGMDGLQLQSQLAAAGCGIPIIFITAYDDKESRGRAMQAGAVAFLGKPFSDEQLLQSIRSALREESIVARDLVSVVDDDEPVRRTTKLLIESFGFRAEAFESAERFLGSGRLHDTSCLIVDVQMPGMNGLQLQSQLAAAGCGIPVIFITAYDDKESRGRAMQAGAAAFLGKPFSDEQLFQTIRSALGREEGRRPWSHQPAYDKPLSLFEERELDLYVQAREVKAKLVVVIDDDEAFRAGLQRLLKSAGFAVRSFASAEDFLDSGHQHETGCLIADIVMPGMSGLDLQAKLNAEHCRIPTIFITAHGEEKSRLQAMRGGAARFLGKPFDAGVLLESVRGALGHI